MKPRFYIPTVVLALAAAFTIRQINNEVAIVKSRPDGRKAIISCRPDWNELAPILDETGIPPIPGAGTYTWKISTSNDSAQFYFNQGINMYYGFHIIEAMASFKKAERFDSACAMIHWAKALTYGPNINDYGYRASPEALAAVSKAGKAGQTATPVEKGLIRAMAIRYTADSADITRKQLNENYAEAMKALYEQYPANPDIQALYADALMLQHPWDLWYTNGTPKPWTNPIRSVLEKLLASWPMHPGANHYYIHVMEASPYAAKALPSAARLGKTNPGLSHLVHMPSHIYLRTGNYKLGMEVNNKAVKSYRRNLELFAPTAGADFLYLIHNEHMRANNALLSHDYASAISAANETVNSIQPDYYGIPAPLGNLVQYISMTPLFMQVQFRKWDELLALKAPDSSQAYASLLYHFGRGMAFASKNNSTSAGAELDAMREYMKDSSLYIPFSPFSPAIDGARVAEQLLLGVIHESRGLKEGAVRHYLLADSIESNMVYNEPRDWLLNPRWYLGNAYLAIQANEKAEAVFQNDLQYNQDNFYSLKGLYQALQRLQKNAKAKQLKAKINKLYPGTIP